MNWPSYWEDINDRALGSPPSKGRKVSYNAAISSQRMDSAGPSMPRARKPFMDGETGQWLKELRARRAHEIEAARQAKQLLKQRLAAAAEARKRREEADARDWQKFINDVEPLKRR